MAKGRARRGTRPQGDNITFPMTDAVVESINKNFNILFKDLHNTSTRRLLSGEGIDANLAIPVTGDLIVATDTTPAKWDRFPIGDPDTVLRTEGVMPEWAKVHLTSDVDEILPVANGGTNVGTYTAGSVVFAGAGGLLLTEDNANFFWNDTDNRLGLGTAVPTVRLDVVHDGGAAVLTAAIRLANTTAATAIATRQDSPALVFSGAGWDTDAVAVSRTTRIALSARAVSGTIVTSALNFSYDVNGAGTFADTFRIGYTETSGPPNITIAGATGEYRLRNAMDSGRYFTIAINDGAGGIDFGLSTGLAKLRTSFDTSTKLVRFTSDQSDPIMNFVAISGTIVFCPAEGGGDKQCQFGRRVSDNSVAVGVQAEFWPRNTATVPTIAQMAPGGASYQWRIENNGDMQFVVTSSKIYWAGRTRMFSPADGVLLFTNAAENDFSRVQLGGTTSSFPSIKRSSAELHARLADDSAFATFQCNALTINAQTGNVAGTTYTPVRSAEVNLDANVTMFEAQYARTGNTVSVSGRFTADPTAPATTTSFEMTLPVASNIGAVEDLAGVAFCGAIAGQGAQIEGSVANNTAVVYWVAGDVTSQSWSFFFQYQVI